MENIKKDFQKVVKMFRDTQPEVTWVLGGGRTMQHPAEYPKAMMTERQMRNGTATVNCDLGTKGDKIAEDFRGYAPFVAWCESYGIKTIAVERVKSPYGSSYQVQIRVTY